MLTKFTEIQTLYPKIHTDYRGDLWTLWKKDKNEITFNHDKVSSSRKNVLRGLHGDYKSHKLVTCLYGELYFVVVDNRPNSPTYRQWDSTILDDKKRTQILLPPGFANGFLVLSRDSIFHYKWLYEGNYPDVDQQFTIPWNDKDLNINWPIQNPILSNRDKSHES
jgi:dTDP-4-dehydrorhamnose 3,5-epimerase|tara:strand:+ start:3027 stop:3521 length:495 start_codon:yes stop_codon:yes gene_type:complete